MMFRELKGENEPQWFFKKERKGRKREKKKMK